MNQMTNAQIQQFKKRFEQGEIDIPKPKWALSRKEAIAAKIPPHNSDYFEVSHLIKLTPLNSVIERLAPFYQKHLLNDNLFTPELNDRKIYRLYQLWKSNQPVTPPVIRAFPSNGFLPDIEILEGNHRIKLCLMNKVKSIPILVEHRLSMEIDPFKNSWFKKAKQ
ncbi:MAG: hypothetical protein JJ978_09350 [Roseivirga sp.]|jgi:hypothetical protein|uniref:hypothetical protein n=1 Tax=Roseivirga sp. TaxID=1964215 RepID=UPI001B115582|nr:hypothetical protein [Roseivirga sp.]MBO6495760.1 hypothetical protein [Roseivirga sp.]